MVLSTTGSVLVSFLWSLTVVLGQGDWGVTYSTQSICVLKGSTVELSCTYKYPSGYNVTSTFWFTKEISTENYVNLSDDPDYRGHVTYHSDEENRHTLMITDLRETDSAEYKFRFITDQPGGKRIGQPGVTLSVTGLQVEVTGGKMKTLTCNTSCPLTGNPTYIWYKNGQQIDESSSHQYKDLVKSYYRASYSCSVKGHEHLHSPTVCIENMTCRTVNYTQRRICVLKGSSVDISCTFAGYSEVTSSLWFSPKQSGRWRDKLIPEDLTTDPGYAGRVEIQNCSGQSILRITGLKEEDSAEYRFTFKTKYNFQWGHDFPGTTLTFPEVQVNVTPATVTEGQNVTLTCITSCPLTGNTTYIWYKKTETSPKASGQSYSITNVTSEDWREYYCEVRNGRGSMYSSTLMVTVAGKQTSVLTACVGITVVVLVLILCLSGLIWFRKSGCNSPNKADGQVSLLDSEDYCDLLICPHVVLSSHQKDSSPMYENISDMVMTSTAEQTSDTDNQDDLHYDSIHYSSSKEQEEHLPTTHS
ncbi:uncharacterized protein LOC105030145 isoform X2 [Esox lucius]|uniref:uncharacterized protein LOC105030145 isoform X2 n=1 Tax=Esox lucius TaxID=8010 RepID=UPI00147774D3|nr:uncharacterized protein LOC105030145 isoform X2 [Esox lucius]